MYAVYRVLSGFFLLLVSIHIIYNDLAPRRDSRRSHHKLRLMHFGYWAFFIQVIDNILQVHTIVYHRDGIK